MPWPWGKGGHISMWNYYKQLEYPVRIKYCNLVLRNSLFLNTVDLMENCATFNIFISKIWYARSKSLKLF